MVAGSKLVSTMSEASSLHVAFIGLGTMGQGMARNIAKAGFPLAVATRTSGKAEAFVRTLSAEGRDARAARTPAAAAEGADVVGPARRRPRPPFGRRTGPRAPGAKARRPRWIRR